MAARRPPGTGPGVQVVGDCVGGEEDRCRVEQDHNPERPQSRSAPPPSHDQKHHDDGPQEGCEEIEGEAAKVHAPLIGGTYVWMDVHIEPVRESQRDQRQEPNGLQDERHS